VESRLYILLCLQLNFLSSRSCDIGCHSALLKVVGLIQSYLSWALPPLPSFLDYHVWYLGQMGYAFELMCSSADYVWSALIGIYQYHISIPSFLDYHVWCLGQMGYAFELMCSSADYVWPH
jgi:hypothetical protein